MSCNRFQTKVTDIVTCRRILFVMVITCFILNSMLKCMFNITAVAMIRKENQTNVTDLFDWNENQKQNVIGVFFWGFAITKFPSGRLAETIGSRKVTGYSMIMAAIVTIATPLIARFNYYILLVSRVLMGFLVGASFPALMPLATKWIPANDQTVFMSALGATSIRTGLVFYISGFLTSLYGWASVFYVIGVAVLIWSCFWFYLIFDSPSQHPRISLKEITSIQKSVKNVKKVQIRFRDIPWKGILTSGPFWAICAAQLAVFLGYITLSNELSSYMDQVLNMDIEQNGLFSGLSYVGGYFAAVIAGFIADALRKAQVCSTTTVRKIFATTSMFIPGVCMLIMAIWGNRTTLALMLFMVTLTFDTSSTAGHAANILDISPNFAGTICGIVNTASAFTAYLSTTLVGLLLQNNHRFEEWSYLFWVLFVIYAMGNTIFLIFASGKVQHWDSYTTVKTEPEPFNEQVKLVSVN